MTRTDPLAVVPPFDIDPALHFQTKALGHLAITDEHVLCCDPLAGGGERFERRIPNGRYPVRVVIAARGGDERIALAQLMVRDEAPAAWVLATRADERPETLRAGDVFGYGVDSGTGCFADVDPSECDVDGLLRQLEKHQRTTWSHAECPGVTDASVIAFSSGYGDGVYPSYWGLDAKGAVVCLVTDFGVVSIPWPAFEERPDARRAYADELMTKLRADTSYGGYSVAMEIGALGREARDHAGELLSMVADTDREGQRGGIVRALALIAREAPEVADLAIEAWRASNGRDDELLTIPRRLPHLSEHVCAALEEVVRDSTRDATVRAESLAELQRHLSRADAILLLDRLVRDPEPEIRVQALSLLRDYDEPALWAARVEQFIDDRSPVARRGLARELRTWKNDVDKWMPVLAPMMADMDPDVQIEAAVSLADSPRYWSMTIPVFEAALERETEPDASGNNLQLTVLWALAQSSIPHEVGQSLAAPLRKRYAKHPAMKMLFRDAEPAKLPKPKRATAKKPAVIAPTKRAIAKKPVTKKKPAPAAKKPSGRTPTTRGKKK